MASDAEIQSAIQTLQNAINTYAGRDTPVEVNGEFSPELYDVLAEFSQGFQNIDGVATILNSNNITIEGIYDPALGEALQNFLNNGEQIDQLRLALGLGFQGQAQNGLRNANAPQQFIENPQLLLQFVDQDLAGIVSALNTLESAELLNERPQELTPDQIAAQPEAIEAMETLIQQDLTFYKNYAEQTVDFFQEQIDALEEDDEARAGLEVQRDNAQRTVDLLNGGLERIENLDPDQQPDPNFEEALRVYVEFLQRGTPLTAYVDGDVDPNARLAPENVIDASGNYTQDYEDFLSAKMQGYQDRLSALEANDDRTRQEEVEYQMLSRTNAFIPVMAEMVNSGAYVHPPAPGAGNAPEEPEVMPIEEARPIIEQAIRHMVQSGGVEVNPVLGEEDDWEFEFASRIGLQAFLIDLKQFLNIDPDDESGVYSPELSSALADAFENPDTRREVANRYFLGREEMVLQLLTALNTYSNPDIVPDLEGRTPANIGQDALITMPDLRPHEQELMAASAAQIPDNELLAMNEMIITLTGYGMEDFLAEGTFDQEEMLLLEAGGDRSQILGEFFDTVRAEAYDAIVRDGRPMSDLEGEIQERMVERFNNLVSDNAAFDVIRLELMRDHIRDAVSDALAAQETMEGASENQREAARITFADNIPGATQFAADYGPNMRAYFIVDPEEVRGVTPEIMNGFGGAVDGQAATLEEARNGPTIGQLITDMEEDFERLDSSAIAQRTMREIRGDLSEKEGLFNRIYNDPRNAEFILENGDMLIESRSGEMVLLSAEGEDLQARYLGPLGINAIEGIGEGNIAKIGEEFDLDALLIRTAAAGYQSLNDGKEWRQNHNPEFFELNGRHYVVGMDRDTNTIRVEALDEEFLTASNAARRVYSYTGQQAMEDTNSEFMQDPAYKFLHDNYGNLTPAGRPDQFFDLMVRQLGTDPAHSDEVQNIEAVVEDYQRIDYGNQPALADAPRVEDADILSSATLMNAIRPDQTQPFIYLHENDAGEGQILVVTPSLKEELSVDDAGNETVSMVHDTSVPPVVRDITDPALHQGMRDLFYSTEVVPPENIEAPAFQDLREWIEAGGRPLLKEVVEQPVYGPASEEGLASLFESAAGFETQGRDIEFGRAIDDVNTLVEILGYDPNAVFLEKNFTRAENAYVVHGVEAGVWQGSLEGHEFLDDHFLVTFMRDGEVVTAALEKAEINSNPYRIPHMIQLEHETEGRLTPQVFAVDRERIVFSDDRLNVPVNEFSLVINRNNPQVEMRTLQEGDPYYGQIEEQGFWNDQSWFDMRQQWRIDLAEWLRSLDNEDGAALEAPAEEALSTQEMLRDCIDEITCDRAGLGSVDDRALQTANTPQANITPVS